MLATPTGGAMQAQGYILQAERGTRLLRLLALLAAGVGLALGRPADAGALAYALASAGLVAGYLLLALAWAWVILPRWASPRVVYGAVVVDVAAVGGALFLTQGIQGNLLILLAPILVAYHAVFFGYSSGLFSATLFSLAYVGLAAVAHQVQDLPREALNWQLLVAQLLLFYLLALLAGSLARRRLEEERPRELQGERPSASSAGRELTVGDLRIDTVQRRVYVGGRGVVLSPTEFQLLHLLAENVGAPLGQETIRDHVWGRGATRQGNVVDVTVHRLRRKLERESPVARVVTVRGRGYMLTP